MSEREIEAARADERRRAGRDVHDELGGDLAAVKLALARLIGQLPQDARLQEQATRVDTLVDAAIASMHRFSHAAQQSASSAPSFVATVRALLDTFEQQSGLKCELHLQGEDRVLDGAGVRGLPSMLRECLTNVGKHAHASHVQVRLSMTASILRLEVEDDGVGLAHAGAAGDELGGYGIRGMRERTQELGGDFSLHAVHPHGTLIRIELPLQT